MAVLLIPQDKGTLKSNNLDAIRLAMALLVVWSHSFAIHLGSEAREPAFVVLNGALTSGAIAVCVFFVISGFLISHSYVTSKSLWSYLWKRVRRIYPAFIVAVALGAFVVAPLYGNNGIDVSDIGSTALRAVFLKQYTPPTGAFSDNPLPLALNGSLWSIPYEFGCYLGVAILACIGLLLRPFAIGTMLGLLMLAHLAFELTGAFEETSPFSLWPTVLPFFLAGVLVYNLQNRLRRSRFLLAVALLSLLGTAWVSREVAQLVAVPALTYSTFYLAFSRKLRFGGAARHGDFSYGTYLFAFPIQQMLQASWGDAISLPAFVVASIVLSLGAGICSWHLIERHFLKQNRSRKPLDREAAYVAP